MTANGRARYGEPMHIITWRGGRPHVITFSTDRITEVAAVAFDDDHRAIAYLATLSRWR